MSGTTFRGVRTADLKSNRANIREHLDGIDELAASIRSNGILQPLIVNDVAGDLIVTDGHRRLEAAKRAQVPIIPCLVTIDAQERQVITTMLAAAMHKELTPIEQGRAFQRLRGQGVSVPEIARTTGYSASVVSNRLLLLDLPTAALAMVEEGRLAIGQATDLAKQVKARRSGSVAAKANKRDWFLSSHTLSGKVICHHHDTHRMLGGIGCGQCWERTIRADERRRLLAQQFEESA